MKPSTSSRITSRVDIITQILVIFGLLVAFLIPAAPVRAQTAIQVSANRVEMRLPGGIRFHLNASSSARIRAITLLYGTNGRNCLESTVRQVMTFSAARTVDLHWDWDFYRSGSVPPGAEIWWQWEIVDDNGATLLTQRKTARIEDTTYAWREIRQQNITLRWTEGDSNFAWSILRLAGSSLERLTQDAGIEPGEDIQLILYPSAAAMQGAILALPDWSGGLAFSDYGVVIIGLAPGQEKWAQEVVPHELAHLVTGALTYNCVGGRVPTWLTEGISVYAEGDASPVDLNALKSALQDGSLTPLNQLAEGFAAGAARADLSYVHSGEVVRFLVHEYGPEKSHDLLANIQAGLTADEALLAVYGFDTTGLDNAWRGAQGYALVPTRPPTQAAAQRTTIPTLALWSAVTATASPTTSPTPLPATPTATVPPPASPTPAPTAAPEPPAPRLPGSAWLIGLAAVVAVGLIAAVLTVRRMRR